MNLVLIFLSFILFNVKSYLLLDPDFGWHLKVGELIIKTAVVPKTDIFSYTMLSYPFVDHEWLTNVILNIGYQKIGWTGLALVFSFISILSILIILKFDFKNKF